ncbi:MAG: hypothetical protein ACR2Q4_04325 [Geminicoccaceae bacterium]
MMPIIRFDPKPTANLFNDLDHLASVYGEFSCGVIAKQAPKVSILSEKGFGHPTTSIIGGSSPNELWVNGIIASAKEKDVAFPAGDGVGMGVFVGQDDTSIAGHEKSPLGKLPQRYKQVGEAIRPWIEKKPHSGVFVAVMRYMPRTVAATYRSSSVW